MASSILFYFFLWNPLLLTRFSPSLCLKTPNILNVVCVYVIANATRQADNIIIMYTVIIFIILALSNFSCHCFLIFFAIII